MKIRSIKNDNKILYKTFENLLINCPNKCNWQGVWSSLEKHLNECKIGNRYCKYKSIGCNFFDDSKIVTEHEKMNDKYHLDLAMKFIKEKKILKKNVKFKIGQTCKISCHPHLLTYTKMGDWFCDGKDLKEGCFSSKKNIFYT